MASMMKSNLLGLSLLLALVSAAHAQTRSAGDVASLFAQAWNAHDMKTFAPTLADDADWVTVTGARYKGRADIQGYLDREQTGWAKTTSMNTSSVAVRELDANAAAVHFNWEITGIIGRDGQPAPPAKGTNLFVLSKQGSDWKVVAGQVALQRATP
jgi:uncharacterized protein (TIGR02246 family)